MDHAVDDGEFADRHLQKMRAQSEDAPAQLLGGLDDGAAAEHRRARREGAETIRRHGGIVVDASDVVERDAELVARHLAHRRHDALALRRQRRGDGKNARRLQAQRHRVATGLQQRARADRRAGAEPGQFRVAGDADAAQFAVCACVALLGAQPLILRLGGGELQAGQVIDVVVHQIVGVAVRHRLDRDQVARPQLDGIESKAGARLRPTAVRATPTPTGGRRRDRDRPASCWWRRRGSDSASPELYKDPASVPRFAGAPCPPTTDRSSRRRHRRRRRSSAPGCGHRRSTATATSID